MTPTTDTLPRAEIQAPAGSPYSRIMGLGSYRASRGVTNDEMCTMIDSTDEWIRKRTGIIERRWATDNETLLHMAVESAKAALARSGVDGDQIDCVIVSTVSHFTQFPALATQVATAIGAHGAAAYDITAACAGFCYALAQADALVRSNAATKVMVIGVERLSKMTNFDDRGTAFLFGDGGGAAVVGPSDQAGIGPVVWGSDGAAADVIKMSRHWDEEGESAPTIQMDGQKVFRWATTTVAKQTLGMLDRAGITPDQLDVFIPHQANDRIIDAMMRTLRLPKHVVVARDIAYMGNTSAASIPLAIEGLYQRGLAHSGQLGLIVGFGAGLVFAGQVIRLP